MRRWRDRDPHQSGAAGPGAGDRTSSGRRRTGQQAVSFRTRPDETDGNISEATPRFTRRSLTPRVGRSGTTIQINQRTLLLGAAAPGILLLLFLISRTFVSPTAPDATPALQTAGPTAQPGATTVPTQGAIQMTVVPIEPSYTVQAGDTLATIARRFNTSVDSLQSINNITDRNALKVGQKLVIP